MTLTIDTGPSIRAYAVARMADLTQPHWSEIVNPTASALRELEMIIALCDGLAKQNALLTELK